MAQSWSENASNGEPPSPTVPPPEHVGLDGFAAATSLAARAPVLLAASDEAERDDEGERELVAGAATVIVVEGCEAAGDGSAVAAAGTAAVAMVVGVAAAGGGAAAGSTVVVRGTAVVVVTTTLHSIWIPCPATKAPSSEFGSTLLPVEHAEATCALICSSPSRQAFEHEGAGSKSETVQAGMAASKTAWQAAERAPGLAVLSKLESERAEAREEVPPRMWRRWARALWREECIAEDV